MHVSWLNVPVPVADVAVHDVQVMGVTFVLSPAHPNPIKFGRIWTAPASLSHDSTPGNGAASEVVVGGTVVGGLVVVVGRCVVEEVVVETARVFDEFECVMMAVIATAATATMSVTTMMVRPLTPERCSLGTSPLLDTAGSSYRPRRLTQRRR